MLYLVAIPQASQVQLGLAQFRLIRAGSEPSRGRYLESTVTVDPKSVTGPPRT